MKLSVFDIVGIFGYNLAKGFYCFTMTSRWISKRAGTFEASGIRRVFDLAAKLTNPINLSIGQPDFDVPEPLKKSIINAIISGKNSYTPTQGTAQLINPIREQVTAATKWVDPGILILSGTSAGLVLAMIVLYESVSVYFTDKIKGIRPKLLAEAAKLRKARQ